MRARIEYRSTPTDSPLTYWVHGTGGYQPPPNAARPAHAPPSIPGKGWPLFIVEHRGQRLWFASVAELDHAIDVLGRRHMPRSRDVAGYPGHDSNRHWLSRLPAAWKPWKVRAALVRELAKLRAQVSGAGSG
ncbi:MAG: hypothetical protein KDA49_07575 [Rhodospirillaceae bacterium]|nr:hypothetical protein [Rhodospirillaceae bacterium]